MPRRIAASGFPSRISSPCQEIVPPSGWWAPARTLMSVDLPAPFWPSSAWTSPDRTSRSTPSRARTPGNTLTMPDIASSGRPAAGEAGASAMAEHGVGDHPGRADDARLRPQLGEHDRQVPGRERQRPAVDDAADLGEQRVAETGRHLAADHHHARVEEADQAGERETEPAPARAHQLDRDLVAGRGRTRDVGGGQRAGFGEA